MLSGRWVGPVGCRLRHAQGGARVCSAAGRLHAQTGVAGLTKSSSTVLDDDAGRRSERARPRSSPGSWLECKRVKHTSPAGAVGLSLSRNLTAVCSRTVKYEEKREVPLLNEYFSNVQEHPLTPSSGLAAEPDCCCRHAPRRLPGTTGRGRRRMAGLRRHADR